MRDARTRKIPALVPLTLGPLSVLLWAYAALVELGRYVGAAPGPGPALAALGGGAALTLAALHPGRWARGLGPWIGPWGRVLLPLGLALGAVPLGVVLLVAFSFAESLSDGGGSLLWLGGLLSALLVWLGRGLLPRMLADARLSAALPLVTAATLLLGLALAAGGWLRAAHPFSRATYREAVGAYLASLPPAQSLRVPASEQEPTRFENLGAWSGLPAELDRNSGIKSRGEPGTEAVPHDDLLLVGTGLGVTLGCSDRSCSVRLERPAQGRAQRRFEVAASAGEVIHLQRDTHRNLLLLSVGGRVVALDGLSLREQPVALAMMAPYLIPPLLWRLSPLVAAALVAALWRRRSEARAWAEAIAAGSRARVEGAWLVFRDGRPDQPAPAGLSDGVEVLVVGAETSAPTYRSIDEMRADGVLVGRASSLAAKAHANLVLLDAAALALAALGVAPLLVAFAVGLLFLTPSATLASGKHPRRALPHN